MRRKTTKSDFKQNYISISTKYQIHLLNILANWNHLSSLPLNLVDEGDFLELLRKVCLSTGISTL
jgi:hypothetical protein